MRYQLSKNTFERKTLANGSELINTIVLDEQKPVNVTIWGKDSKGVEFPNFATLKGGDIIDGNLWTNPTTGKSSLYAPKVAGKGNPMIKEAMAQKQDGIAKSMDRKEHSIERTLDRKEDSFKISGTARDATIICNGIGLAGKSDEEVKVMWLKWRGWLYQNYSPFDNEGLNSNGDTQPFEEAEVTEVSTMVEEDIDVDSIPF